MAEMRSICGDAGATGRIWPRIGHPARKVRRGGRAVGRRRGSAAGGAVAAGAAGGFVEGVAEVPGNALVAGDDELRDALVRVDEERLLAVVHEQDAQLAAIVLVDGAGRVEDR